jgi:transposase
MRQEPEQIIRQYSLAFKKQIVKEYEAGASASQLRRRYGLSSTHMVVKWVNRYSREGVRHKLMVVQSPEEQERVKELETRIAELEKLTAQLSLDKFMLECSLAVAEEKLGYQVKKKPPTPSSTKPEVASQKSKAS